MYGAAGAMTQPNVVLTADTQQYQQQMQQAGQSTSHLANLVDGLGHTISSVTHAAGKVTLGFSAADTAALTAAVALAGRFQDQMRNLQSQSNVLNQQFGNGTQRMQQYTQAVDGLRSSFGTTTQAAAQLVQTISGFEQHGSTQGLSQLATTFQNMAKTTGENASQLAQSVLSLGQTMGTSIQNTQKYADMLVTMADASNTTAESLANFAAQIGPLGRTLNMTEQQVTGFAAAFSKAGQDGYRASNVFNQLVSGLGQAIQTHSPALQQYANLLNTTVNGLQRMSGSQVIAASMDAIYQRGPQAIQSLNNLGIDGVMAEKTINAVVQQNGGSIQGVINQAQNAYGNGAANQGAGTLSDQFSRLGQTMEQVGESIGGPLLQGLKLVMPVINDLADAFKVIMQSPIGKLAGILMGIAAPIAAIAGAGLMAIKTLTAMAAIAGTARSSVGSGLIEGIRGFDAPGTPGGKYGRQGAFNNKMLEAQAAVAAGTANEEQAAYAKLGEGRAVIPFYNTGYRAGSGARNLFSRRGRAEAGRASLAARLTNGIATNFIDPQYDANIYDDAFARTPFMSSIKNTFKGAGATIASAVPDMSATAGWKASLADAGASLKVWATNLVSTDDEVRMAAKAAGQAFEETAGNVQSAYAKLQVTFKDNDVALGRAAEQLNLLAAAAKSAAAAETEVAAAGEAVAIPSVMGTVSNSLGIAAKGTAMGAGQFMRGGAGLLGDMLGGFSPLALGLGAVTLGPLLGSGLDKLFGLQSASAANSAPGAITPYVNGQVAGQQGLYAPPALNLMRFQDTSAAVKALGARNTWQAGSMSGLLDPNQVGNFSDNLSGILNWDNNHGAVGSTLNGIGHFFKGTFYSGPKGLLTGHGMSGFGQQADAIINHDRGVAGLSNSGQQLAQEWGIDAESLLSAIMANGKGNTDVSGILSHLSEGDLQKVMGRYGIKSSGTQSSDIKSALNALVNQPKQMSNNWASLGYTQNQISGMEATDQSAPGLYGSKFANQFSTGQLFNVLPFGVNTGALNFAIAQQQARNSALSPFMNPLTQLFGNSGPMTGQFAGGVTSTPTSAQSMMNFWNGVVAKQQANGGQADETTLENAAQATQQFQQSLVGTIQQIRSYNDQLHSMAFSQQQFQESMGWQAQQEALSVSREQQDFGIQRSRAEYNFNLQRSRSQQDYDIQRQRSQQDFDHQLNLMIKQAAQSMMDIYKTNPAEQVTSAQFLLYNNKLQTGYMNRQENQLQGLRNAGLSNDSIQQLGLTDASNNQEVNTLYQEMMSNPSIIQSVNQGIAARLTAAGRLVTDTSSQQWQEQEYQFNTSLSRSQKDFTRSMDRSAQDFDRTMGQQDQDFGRQLARQQADFDTSVSHSWTQFRQGMDEQMWQLQQSMTPLSKTQNILNTAMKSGVAPLAELAKGLSSQLTPAVLALLGPLGNNKTQAGLKEMKAIFDGIAGLVKNPTSQGPLGILGSYIPHIGGASGAGGAGLKALEEMPNLPATSGMCLADVERAFGAWGNESTALAAWFASAGHRHTGPAPAGTPIFWGAPHGEQQDGSFAGHVAISAGGGMMWSEDADNAWELKPVWPNSLGWVDNLNGVNTLGVPLKGFATGSWDLDQDQVAQVHKGEMILPTQLANAVRSAIGGGYGVSGDAFKNLKTTAQPCLSIGTQTTNYSTTSHTNFTGDVTVVAQDPMDFANQMKQRARLAALAKR